MDPKHPSRLILASRMAQRADVLRDAGYWFEVADNFDFDSLLDHAHLPPGSADHWGPVSSRAESCAADLPMHRAITVAETGHPRIKQGAHTVILTAQTLIIDSAGELLGQAANVEQARTMFESIARHGQYVVTSVAMLQPDSRAQQTLSDATQLRLRPVDSAQVEQYLQSQKWRDLIGAFDRLNPPDPFRIELTGDPTTAQGLPMIKMVKCLEEEWSIRPAEGD